MANNRNKRDQEDRMMIEELIDILYAIKSFARRLADRMSEREDEGRND